MKDLIIRIAQEGTMEQLEGMRGFTSGEDSKLLEDTIKQLDLYLLKESDDKLHISYEKWL